MKRVGVVTIIDNANFGNRLQNYATQTVIKSLGYDCSTFRFVSDSSGTSSGTSVERAENVGFVTHTARLLRNILRASYMYFLFVFPSKAVWPKSSARRINTCRSIRRIQFGRFTRKWINEKPIRVIDSVNCRKLDESFSALIVGSDQVWNPFFGCDPIVRFLSFSVINKKIAYAASFGVSSLPNDVIADYIKGLNDLTEISVREDDGATIVAELTQRDSTVLIDPTMMLTKSDWLSLSRKSQARPNRPYVLAYFLGDLESAHISTMKSFASSHGCLLVDLSERDPYRFAKAGPSEFIDYVDNSSVVLTDSFHGAVFSIILGKPFYVFERKTQTSSMNSRITTLLKTFRLENRQVTEVPVEITEIDYSYIPEILEDEKAKALAFLSNSLEGPENRK